jgi:uncharacterized membrane protein
MVNPINTPPRAQQVVWLHLLVLALVACLGLIVARAVDWTDMPWPTVWGSCVWFAGLCVLTAIALAPKVRPL